MIMSDVMTAPTTATEVQITNFELEALNTCLSAFEGNVQKMFKMLLESKVQKNEGFKPYRATIKEVKEKKFPTTSQKEDGDLYIRTYQNAKKAQMSLGNCIKYAKQEILKEGYLIVFQDKAYTDNQIEKIEALSETEANARLSKVFNNIKLLKMYFTSAQKVAFAEGKLQLTPKKVMNIASKVLLDKKEKYDKKVTELAVLLRAEREAREAAASAE